jgi:sigma-B regulation protein RsbU (phosphoserine phosphatase)
MLTLPARLDAVRRSGLLDTGPEEPFDRLTRLACELLGTPFGFVTVVDERRSFWKSCIGVPGTALAERQNPVGESFCQYIIATDGAVIIDDARLDPMTRDNPSIESMGVIAWAGFPVRSPDGQVLGSFCVVDNRPRAWQAQDLRTLEVLAHAAGGEVALRIAADEAGRDADRARASAVKYQQLARTMQESLLPRDLPEVDGIDLTTACRLGDDDVLGDFYDAVPTPTGWAVFLGDVSGKGVFAARTSALVRFTLRASAQRASSPAIVLTELDDALHRWFAETDVPGFVTVAYLALRRSGTGFAARLCTAGHPAAVVRRADGSVHGFGEASTALGILPRLSLRIAETELEPGDCVLLRSNGVSEATLLAALRAHPGGPGADVAGGLLGAVLEASGDPGGDVRDDMVVLALRVR